MKKIGFKLWSGMMILVFVMLLLLWLFQIVFLEKFYLELQIEKLINKSEELIEEIEKSGLLEEKQQFKDEEFIRDFAYKNHLSVEILNNQGVGVYQASSGNESQVPSMQRVKQEAFQTIMEGSRYKTTLTHPRFATEFIVIGLPIQNNNQTIGAFVINMPLAPVEETTEVLQQQLFYVILILLVIAILLSYIISRTLTKPILELSEVSEKIAKGDFSVRTKTKTGDEIGKLAVSMNTMAQELSKAEGLRKDFIANVSHELRTPLSLIQGYAETLRDVSGDKPEKREKQLGIIIDESIRLSKLVDELLDLSRLQQGVIQLEENPFLLENMLNKLQQQYEVIQEELNVKLKIILDKPVEVVADEQRIQQVLHNLVMNALKHTEPGGQVTIQTINQENKVRVEVIDTGTGIEQEDLPYVWERYYKGKNKKTKGTGLGLAIVKSLLEAHDFTYGVLSEKGIGTTFWFEINKK